MFGNWGSMEILIVVAIILLLFGPKRLPALSRAIGRSIRDFKKGLQDVKDDIERAGDEDEDEDEDASPGAEKSGSTPGGEDSGKEPGGVSPSGKSPKE